MENQSFLNDFKNVLYVDRIYNALQILNTRRQTNNYDASNLGLSELRLFSQNGEDGVLDAILLALGDVNPYFVEFGVGDGWSCNCRLLAEVFDWKGLFLEIDQADCEKIRQRYVNSEKIHCVNEAVTPENINELFIRHNVPKDLGVLSIDIDGQDYWTWKALDDSFKPAVIIMEYNSALDPNRSVVEAEGCNPETSLTRTWGASLKAMVELGEAKGYQLVHLEMAGANIFLVRKDIIQSKNIVFKGITSSRSPNYGLRGANHSEAVLFSQKDKNQGDRPQFFLNQ